MIAISVAGWVGTACFFLRFLVQWLQSERAGRSVSPPSFWILSILGALLLGTYSIVRGEPVLFLGHVVNGAIYWRNLVLARSQRKHVPPGKVLLLLSSIVALALLLFAATAKLGSSNTDSLVWMVCAAVGQLIWSSRFVLQWWSSERRGESHFPPLFWWLSLGGNVLLLSYAVHLRDPVFVASYLLGPVVQVRNLVLHLRSSAQPASPA